MMQVPCYRVEPKIQYESGRMKVKFFLRVNALIYYALRICNLHDSVKAC